MLGYSIAEAPIGGAPFAGTVTLPVATAPGVPRNVAAAAGINSITITFQVPLSDGGAAITGYPVRLSTGEEQTVTGLSATFTGLSAGVARTAQAAATNSAGTSAYSAASNSVVPIDPSDQIPSDAPNYYASTIMNGAEINLTTALL